jgi:hypothetical protein
LSFFFSFPPSSNPSRGLPMGITSMLLERGTLARPSRGRREGGREGGGTGGGCKREGRVEWQEGGKKGRAQGRQGREGRT